MKIQILLFIWKILIVSISSKNVRIIGGSPSNILEFPYIVSIRTYETNAFICAGSIISDRHILTTASCVQTYEDSFSDIRIFAGTTTLMEFPRSVYSIQKIHIHPDFEGEVIGKNEYHRDVAVITVTKVILFHDKQRPIELPRERVLANSWATIFGWGFRDFPYGELSDQLQKVRVKILSQDECRRRHIFPVRKDQICTFANAKGVGPGDAGGPVVSDGVIIGLVSYSVPWVDDPPEIQTDIFANLDFIQSIVEREFPVILLD